ncbi:MAG: response regulator [Desulfobacteraceae bacterium]|nr:MAG: response regulator [Desulfobacteraceae bacterium]
MQNASLSKPSPRISSISRRFSYAFIGVVTGILLAFAAIAIFVNSTRIDNELEKRLDSTLKLSTVSLPTPLWNLDNDIVNDFIEALFLDASIVYAEVSWGGEVIVTKKRTEFKQEDASYFRRSSNFIARASDILFEGSKVGTIELAMSRERIKKELISNILSIIALTILIIAAIALTSLVISKRSITQPISRLLAATQEMAQGDFQRRIEELPGNELGKLAEGFNQMAENLSSLINELEHRNDMSRALISTRDLEEILDRVAQGVAESGGYDRVRLYLYDERQDSLVCHTAFGMEKEQARQLKLSLSGDKKSVSQWVFREKTPYVVKDPSRDDKCDPELARFLGVTSYAAVPLLAGEKALGVMAVDWVKTKQPFSEDRVNSLIAFANTAALAIENAMLYTNLEERVQKRTRQLEIANQRLKELDKVKSDFLSTVSHELRTPLTSVLGFARIIAKKFQTSLLPHLDQSKKKTLRDAKRMQENLEIIIEEGERLTRLINEVLDLEKIEAGKMEWKMREVSLLEVVETAVNATASLAKEKELEVKVVPRGEDFQFCGDPDRLTQVVTNLLSNAIKFTEEGFITCELEREEDVITVKVIDTGIGLAQDDIELIFDRFKQIGDTLTDRPKGTGLGLPISKEIIEYHGGRIWAESELGRGSTMIFTLPVIRRQATVTKEIPLFSRVADHISAQFAQHGGDTPRILIVDDEKHIRALLIQQLEEAGYSIIEAQNGREAIHLARTERPDLIILDILMPGLDGFEVTTILKQSNETADIPIMILSIVEDKDRGYRLGVDSYLTKPVDPEQLLSTVSSLATRGQQPPAPIRKKILVIEDDAGIVRAIQGVLSEYQITTVDNGQEGIRMAQQEHPNLIILDARLAKEGAIVKALRSMSETSESQIIVLTESIRAEITTILDTIHTDERSHAKKIVE